MSDGRGFKLLMVLLVVAGLAAAGTNARAAHTEVYRFTNETGGPVQSMVLRFEGADPAFSVGLVLGVQHPLVNCSVGETEREINVVQGATEVFLTWPASPLCAGGMIKVQVTSAEKAPVYLGGEWLAETGAPIAAVPPSEAFQGCDIVVWASLNLQMQSLVAWVSNTGTTDMAQVHCIVENDPERNANFLFVGEAIFEGEDAALPFHKATGTICWLDHTQRTSDLGAVRLSAVVTSGDCEVESEKLSTEICLAWDGEIFEIVPCNPGP